MKLSALDDGEGKPVDWWFMYKLPHSALAHKGGPEEASSGFEYLYYDGLGTSGLSLSPHRLGQTGGALYATLQRIFAAPDDPDGRSGWILYNDEIPETKHNNEEKGHCKGVLAFDEKEDSGILLLHSTPRFPVVGQPDFPEDEKIYAQTFICLTLENHAAAELIAGQLLDQQVPQVYASHIPKSMPQKSNLYKLSQGNSVPVPAGPSHISFATRSGKKILCLAKNRRWGEDFWIDLVGPHLKADLNIETWRRGQIPSQKDDDGVDDVSDITGIDLAALGGKHAWPYTKDHAKWAVSTDPDWVCVADINRQVSQEKRGGGAICINEPDLWRALTSIEA